MPSRNNPIIGSGDSESLILGWVPYHGPKVAEWIHFTLLWDNSTHYKSKSVDLWGAYELSN